MKTFNVNGKLGSYTINIPTTIKEITPEYLSTCVENIKVAPEYSLVAIVSREKLSILINMFKKKQEPTISVVPLFVKSGDTESNFIKSLNTADILVVGGTELSLGYHVNSPFNKLTISNIVALCQGDNDLYNKSFQWNEVCHFIEFKIVPNNVIHGVVKEFDENVKHINSFVIPTTDLGN